MNSRDLTAIFGRIPQLKTMTPDEFEIESLGGLTNRNYRLFNDHQDYVLRVPRAKTSHTINRKAESFNVDQVIQLGLAPSLLWRDDSGLSLTRCITQSRALSSTDMQDSIVSSLLIDRVAELHRAEFEFEGKTDLTALLHNYFNLMQIKRDPELTRYFEKALTYSLAWVESVQLVPSHNDLVFENLLLDHEEQLWMIDWEYSAMSSPYWDIATLCNVGRLNPEQTSKLLDSYKSRVIKLDYPNLRRFQFMLQVLTIGWLTVYTTEPVESEIAWLKKLGV